MAGFCVTGALPPPAPSVPTYPGIYVANFFSPTYTQGGVLVFALNAKGNTAPLRSITGAATNLGNVRSVCVDSDYYTYVVTDGTYSDPDHGAIDIWIFAPGADGNIAPLYSISGSNTGLQDALAVRIGPDGFLWVLNGGESKNGTLITEASVLRFPLQTGGNIVPTSILKSTSLNPTLVSDEDNVGGPSGIAWDSAGNFYISNLFANTLQQFLSGTTGSDVIPNRQITGIGMFPVGPYGVAVVGTKLFTSLDFSSNPGSIDIFNTTDNGAVSPSATISGSDANTDYPLGMDTDASGNIWVSNGGSPSPSAIYKWPSTASGNVAPSIAISGSATLLNDPFDVVYVP